MALAAAQVIDTLAARLSGATSAGTRVYTDRLWPLDEASLPAWRVTASEEDIEPAMIDGANVHTLLIDADGFMRAASGVDDAMHTLALEGLTALCALPAPYGLQAQGIDRDITREGESSVARIRLRLAAQFYVRPEAPQTII